MEDYTIIPEYNSTMRKIEEEAATAALFNRGNQVLLNNDAYIKVVLDKTKEEISGHKTDSKIHVTAEEKISWTGKAEDRVVTAAKDGLMLKSDKTKLDTVKANAEENQNTFTNIKVGSTVIAANTKTAQMEIAAGDNIKLTGDNATKKVVIEAKIPVSLPANGGNAATVNGYTVNTNVPTGAKFTDTIYAHPSTHPASVIVQDANNRFMTDEEKSKITSVGDKTSLITQNKSSIVSAINECFTNANNGKQVFANVVGGSSANTFAQLAANAQGIKNTRDNLQDNVNTGLVHLKNMGCITEPLTADKVPTGILEANNRISSAAANYNAKVAELVAMTTDRNNWINIANSKKSIIEADVISDPLPLAYGGTANFNFNFGFVPERIFVKVDAKISSYNNMSGQSQIILYGCVMGEPGETHSFNDTQIGAIPDIHYQNVSLGLQELTASGFKLKAIPNFKSSTPLTVHIYAW